LDGSWFQGRIISCPPFHPHSAHTAIRRHTRYFYSIYLTVPIF
jgi:hypothetical protein